MMHQPGWSDGYLSGLRVIALNEVFDLRATVTTAIEFGVLVAASSA